MKKILFKLGKFLIKKHKVIIGLEQKFILFLIIFITLFFIIPFIWFGEVEEAFNDDIYLTCTHPMLQSCERLDIARDYCISAERWFSIKNCTEMKGEING